MNRFIRASVLFISLISIVSILVILLHLLIQSFQQVIFENHSLSWFFNGLSNSFSSILLGVLLTVLVRSSSIVITIAATLVAAGFPFESGIFIIFGANVGTTIPSTLVSKFKSCGVNDYCRMMNTSSMHYFNNLVTFALFFPLQLSFDYLGRSSRTLVEWLGYDNVLSPLEMDTSFNFLEPLTSQIIITDFPLLVLMVLLIAIVILMRLLFILLHNLFDSFITSRLTRQIENPKKHDIKFMSTGIWTSALLQSSSSTLYILMPLVRQFNCDNRDMYPLILGVNVGTCFTTIMFAWLLNSELALAIGFAHLLYNIFSLLIFTYLPLIKELPIMGGTHLVCYSYEDSNKNLSKKYPRYNNKQ
ncbi:MAG: hypothetical protein QM479_16580 [Pseudomonadota bacterium]